MQGYTVCLERSTPIPCRRQNVTIHSRKYFLKHPDAVPVQRFFIPSKEWLLKVWEAQHPGMYSRLLSLPPLGKQLPHTIPLLLPIPGQACCQPSLQKSRKDRS